MLTAVSILAVAYVVLMVFEWFSAERALIESISTEADIIASNSTAALAFSSPEDAREVLLSANRDPRVRAAALYDQDGDLFASFSVVNDLLIPDKAPSPGISDRDGRVWIVMPVREGPRPLGALLLVASLSSRSQVFVYYALLLTGVFGVGLILASLLSKLLQRRITSPITALTRAVQRVAEDKDFSVRVADEGDAEVATLASSFNFMLQEIEERDRALLAREREYRTLVEHSPDIITRYDISGRVLYINPAVYTLFRRQPSYYLGRNALEAFSREDQKEAWSRTFNHVLQTKEPAEVEISGASEQGSEITVHVQVVPEFSGDGSLKSILSLARDISERKRMEELLRQAKDRAEAAARAKSAFLANMSHDIRTPLTSIIGFAEILSERVSGDNRELSQTIHEGGKRLLETLNSVLDLARLEGSVSELNRTEVNVCEEIRKLIRLFQPRAEAKGLSLVLHLPTRDVIGCIDSAAYGRVLMNLVGNAIKFTRKGEVCVEIRPAGEFFETIVRDSGPGISTEFQSQLFSPFSRESSGASSDAEGSGLGLAITKQLVELMGGHITVKSKQGHGACFTVTLPATSSQPVEKSLQEPEFCRSKRILLVEDNKNTQKLFKNLIGDRFQLEIASNSFEALRETSGSAYDIIFMDIGLESREAGVECTRRIRQSEAHQSVPIIAFTAYAVGDERERYRQLGFDDLLEKPFDAKTLNDLLDRHLTHPVRNP